MTSYTPFHYSFYLVYKFIELTTSKNKQHLVAESTLNLLLICLTNNIAAIILFSRVVIFFPENIYFSITLFSIIPISLYFLCRKLFLKGRKYDNIVKFYNERNVLKKYHFVIITVLYMVLSLATMIWAGINYSS